MVNWATDIVFVNKSVLLIKNKLILIVLGIIKNSLKASNQFVII
jgi:hypothetical protein